MSTISAQLDHHVKKIVDQLYPKVGELLDYVLGAQVMYAPCVSQNWKNHQLLLHVTETKSVHDLLWQHRVLTLISSISNPVLCIQVN